MQAHDTADEDTQHMCFHSLQFLQTALTFDPSSVSPSPTSQLCLPLENATTNPAILPWAFEHYHVYNILIGSPPNPPKRHQSLILSSHYLTLFSIIRGAQLIPNSLQLNIDLTNHEQNPKALRCAVGLLFFRPLLSKLPAA